MWEAFSNVLVSDNGTRVIISIVILVLIASVLARMGLFSVHSAHVKIGDAASDKERTIIRHQVEYIRNSTCGFESQIPKDDTYDKYRGRFVLERIFDEMLNWILFNHIETSSTYITIKQDIVWNIVLTFVDKPKYHTDEFREKIARQTEKTIRALVDIRKEYK